MRLERIQECARRKHYSVRPDAILHARKESFTEEDIVYAVLNGRVVE